MPFQPEYPGNRQWNREAAQHRFRPAAEPGDHPHWDKILEHCFADLDHAIKESEWAKRVNVNRGYDYGLLWIACLLRHPLKPLPYLFLYGEQDSGKSSLHEAISLLMTKGVAEANRALKDNQSDFNGELAGAILAVIEEIDITKEKGAYSKIKDWTTSPTLWIRQMRTDAYPIPNSLHFIQVANSPEHCPVFPGDTRITVIHVPKPKVDIPKEVLMARLREEAPAFMRTLLETPIPAAVNRFQIPVIETQNKMALQDFNRGSLDQFLRENCFHVPGERILLSEFWEKFQSWLPPEERGEWSRKRIVYSLRGNCAGGDGRGQRPLDRKPLLGRQTRGGRRQAVGGVQRKAQTMTYIRPLSTRDIRDLAEHLLDTQVRLSVGLSELGFDPRGYSMRLVRQWLYEAAGLYRANGTWQRGDA